MKKKDYITFAIIASIAFTGCSKGESKLPSQSNNSSSKDYYNDSGSYQRPSGSEQGQGTSYAGGFSFPQLEEALKKTGDITESGESYNANIPNVSEAKKYGDIVILLFDQEAPSYYAKGMITLNGREAKIYSMVGWFILVSFDEVISDEGIKAFGTVGGL